ncbi:MAG: 5'-nucleotidase C-terminal domain-containing protein, partial [Candidatus Bipolaricaulota bacterium]
MIEVMNAAEVDLSVIGNHEFDYGQKRLLANMDNAEFNFILANIAVDESEADISRPPAYLKIKTGFGAELTFLGLEVGEKYPSTLPTNLYGLRFMDPIETAEKYSYLSGESDVFIGLTHLGYEWDRELAGAVGSFDVIVGGNSATVVDQPSLTNGVLITQAGEDMEYLGQVTITFDEEQEVLDRSGKLLEFDDIKGSDDAVSRVIGDYREDVEEIFSRKINHLDRPIEGTENLGCLMNDAIVSSPQLKALGYDVDVLFQNSGGIRVDKLEAGDLTVGDVFDLEPFGNHTVVYKMTLEDIRTLIRNDYGDGGPTHIKVTGIMYEVQINPGGEVEYVILTDYTGVEIPEDRTYRVAMNEYIASSYEFTARNDGENTYVRVNDAIVTYLEDVVGEFKLNHTYRDLNRTFKSFVGGGEVIARTEVRLSSKGKTDGSTTTGNLMADAIKEETDVDISTFPSYSGLNEFGDTIRGGMDVTEARLISLYGNCIGENKATVGTNYGSDLEGFLLQRGQAYDNVDLQVAGVDVMYKEKGGKLSDIETDLNPEKTYRVSFNSYAYGSDYA